MVVNENCIRDILGYLIQNLELKFYSITVGESVRYSIIGIDELCEHLSQYQKDTIIYSVKCLDEIGFIRGNNLKPEENTSVVKNIQIYDVTYSGRRFYQSIQPEKTWKKTKSIISKVGNHTLEFIESVAHDIAVESSKQIVTIAMQENI